MDVNGAVKLTTFNPGIQLGPLLRLTRSIDQWLTEPSLVFCTVKNFLSHAGPIGTTILKATLDWDQFSVSDRCWSGVDRTWRATFSVRYLRSGECPSEHFEWHVDRISSGGESYQLTDYSFNLAVDAGPFVFSAFIPESPHDGMTLATTATECIDEEIRLPLPENLQLNPGQFSRRVDKALNNDPAVKRLPLDHIVYLSPTTIHRPPTVKLDGWRIFFRLGPTVEPYSHYSDRYTKHHVSSIPASGIVQYRENGKKEVCDPVFGRSVPL